MKKSELKGLIKEAMMEILPELMEIMVEGISSQSIDEQKSFTQNNSNERSIIRQKYIESRSNDYGYGDFNKPKAPNNPKSIIDGEQFASGKGILEWYKGSGGKQVMKSEFNHTKDDMDSFMKKKFGV